MLSRQLVLSPSLFLALFVAGCGAASPMSPGAAKGGEVASSHGAMQPEYEESAPADARDDDAPARSEAKAEVMAAPAQQPTAATPSAPGSPAASPVAQSTSAPMSPPAPPAKPVAPARAAPAGAVAKEARDEGRLATVAPPPPPPVPVVAAPPPEPQGTEDYKDYGVNPVTDPKVDRFSTFAIDVDTASYAIARRKITEGALPPYQSVRAEEMVNAFDYGYASPREGAFGVELAAAPSPFQPGHHVLRIGVQGKRVSLAERKPVHLVYLIDTSGSMQSDDKIGLAKRSLRILTDSLKPGDTVALCTYAGNVREVLPPTGIDKKSRILAAIEDLSAGGSTAMASGIDLAYDLASRTLVRGHTNRVVVLTDGDANVGPMSHEQILALIRKHRGEGITLSTIGYGMGNYKDTMLEQLADNGDGNYSYIDGEAEAQKVFHDQVSGLLEVIARDVKIQVELDPNVVKTYRLIGYENRDIADKDFRNDKVDAGEIGSGHDVTALYDVVLTSTAISPVIVRVRHKEPLGPEVATEQVFPMSPASISPTFEAAPASLRFATAVGGFAEVLRHSPHVRGVRFSDVEKVARAAANDTADQQGFLDVVRRARQIAGEGAPVAVAGK